MSERIFLDTNVYIVGVADIESIEWRILQWLGFDGSQPAQAEVVVSAELIAQILRVGKRLYGKDWAGSTSLGSICSNYVVRDHTSPNRTDADTMRTCKLLPH